MDGAKYLLDTNIIICLLKGDASTLEALSTLEASTDLYAYSSISRMEVLGYPGSRP